MKQFISILFSFVLLLAFAAPTQAQVQTPAASPTAELKQKVGLTDVTIVYSRPSAKGRTVFAANGLVPMGQAWRTGANSATKISFSDPVKVGGVELKKGDYALLTVPGDMEWKAMFFPYETTNWGAYPDKTPAVTVTIKAEKMGAKVETFTIDLNDVRNESASIVLMWENTRVAIPFTVEVDSRVMASIDRVMAGPSANDYAAAAGYYLDNKKDLNKALEWIKKANASNPSAYWNLYREALILGELGLKKEAIAAAEKSMAEAQKAKNEEYVKMNKDAIAKWK
jgi:hypothetical protein